MSRTNRERIKVKKKKTKLGISLISEAWQTLDMVTVGFFVAVSVLPQVIFKGITKKGTKIVGGVKFNFPKTFPLKEVSANYLAALIHWHCEAHLPHLGKSDLRLCYAVDIPTSTVFPPPKSYKRRRQQIEEACNEITQRWPNLPPQGEG